MRPVIGVLGGSGGVGASSFAAVLAASAGSAVLADVDAAAGGIDVLLGIEHAPGARWSGLRLEGGHLDPRLLLAGLPRWGRCHVLAADTPVLDPDAVDQVLDAAAVSDAEVVVADLPRAGCAVRTAAVLQCNLVVVLARCDVAGLVAAHAAIGALADAAAEVPVGVVLRRGAVSPDEAATLVGAPLLGTVAPLSGAGRELDADHLPRALRRVAAGVLHGARAPSAAAGALPVGAGATLSANGVGP